MARSRNQQETADHSETTRAAVSLASSASETTGKMTTPPSFSMPSTRRRTTATHFSSSVSNRGTTLMLLLQLAVLTAFLSATPTSAFSSNGVLFRTTRTNDCRKGMIALEATSPAGGPPDDDIARLQAKARALLEKSKAKLAASQQQQEQQQFQPSQELSSSEDDEANGAEEETNGASTQGKSPIPFFAAKSTVEAPVKRQAVTKTVDEQTGLITTDGEKMAQYSEQEEWERRPLSEVFENELSDDDDVYSQASQQLAQRDVAASIWNLRKELQNGDYQRIFDKRNRFIGEVE